MQIHISVKIIIIIESYCLDIFIIFIINVIVSQEKGMKMSRHISTGPSSFIPENEVILITKYYKLHFLAQRWYNGYTMIFLTYTMV